MLFYYSRMNVCMNEKEGLLKVGKYNPKFNEVLGIKIEELEIYRSKGLPSHMVKRNYSYTDDISWHTVMDAVRVLYQIVYAEGNGTHD